MKYSLRPEDVSFVDRAPLRVREEVIVSARPDAVWPALAEADAWPQWFAGVKAVRYTSAAPHGVGSTRSVHVGPARFDEEIMAFDPAQHFAFRVMTSNVPVFRAMVEVITLEPVGDQTRVVYRQALEPRIGFRPITAVLRTQFGRALRKGLRGLAPWVAARSVD